MSMFNDKTKEIKVTLTVLNNGGNFCAELSYNGISLNKETDGFAFDLSSHENKKLDCILRGKELFCQGKLIKKYESVIKEQILEMLVSNGTGRIMLDDLELARIPYDSLRGKYNVAVFNDDKYVIVESVPMHVHTENSLLDGIIKIPELAKKVEYACVITDHGNMFGCQDMLKEFKKQGKKAIIGEEFYIQTPDGPRPTLKIDGGSDIEQLMFDNTKEQNPDGLNGEHIIAIAKNNEGLKNLYKLSSNAYNLFYRKPHITLTDLISHKNGLIVTTACIASPLGQFVKEYLRAKEDIAVKEAIENGGEFFYETPGYKKSENDAVNVYIYNHKHSRQFIDTLRKEFKDDFYLEYQDHDFPLEKAIMDEIVRIRNEEYQDVKIIATTDAHYLNKEDAYVHELFLCNQTKKTIDDPKHMRFSGSGYYVFTSEEMVAKFPKEYLEATLDIEEKVHYEPVEEGYHLPIYPLPEGFKDDNEYFKYLTKKGFKEKFANSPNLTNPVYLDRLKTEGQVIKQMGWPSYFLIVQDFIRWAEDDKVNEHWKDYFPDKEYDEIPKTLLKDYKIMIGTGRGSGAGSLINYCLGITKIDPIKYDLKFERFLNPDRISMPDIDTDIEDALRSKVLDYVRFKYGAKKVANIITFGTAAAKNSIKTINRVLGYSVLNGDNIAKYIPEKPGIKIIDALEDKDFKDLYNNNPEARNIIDLAMKIEGLKTSQSIHPCGVEVCDKNITEYMPEVLMQDPETGEKVWVTQMEGPTCEELGCLKMDFLGLRTLGYVHETLDSIKKNKGIEIDYETIPLDEMDVYKFLAEGNTASIFQCESDMFTTVIKKTLKDYKTANGADCFNRLVAMNALVRPGSNIFIDDFANYILHPDEAVYLVPELEPILKETYGIILYQEQTMRITRDLAGFSAGQADTVRKAMGKKKKYIMDEYKDYFVHGNKKMGIKGCVENGIPEEKAEELWDVMALAASYSFNKSHAVAYSVHSIRTAWLCYHYQYEYITAVLNSFSNDTERLAKYLNVAREKKMKLLPPSINNSQENFSTDGNAIQIGISGIKGINAVAKDIIAERDENGVFTDFSNFLERMSYFKNFSKKTLESLTYAGMLDEYCGSRLNKINQLDTLAAYVKGLKDYRKKKETYTEKLEQYTNELKDFALGELKKKPKAPKEPVKPELILSEDNQEMDMFDLIMKEKVYTGMYISGNPMELFEKYLGKCPNCSNIKAGQNSTVCGIVQDVSRKVSKKGNTFYTFKLENEGVISGIFFSKNGESISDGEAVKLEGEVRINEFGVNITVRVKEDLNVLRSFYEKLSDIKINLPDSTAVKYFQQITFPAGTRKLVATFNNKPKEFNGISIDPKTAELLIEAAGGIENIQFD